MSELNHSYLQLQNGWIATEEEVDKQTAAVSYAIIDEIESPTPSEISSPTSPPPADRGGVPEIPAAVIHSQMPCTSTTRIIPTFCMTENRSTSRNLFRPASPEQPPRHEWTTRFETMGTVQAISPPIMCNARTPSIYNDDAFRQPSISSSIPLDDSRAEIGVLVEAENDENVLTMSRRIAELMKNLEGKRERTRQHLQNGEYSLRSDYNSTAQNNYRANSTNEIMTSTQATSVDMLLLNTNDREDGEISHDEDDIVTKHNGQPKKIASKQSTDTSRTRDSIESTKNKRKSTSTTTTGLSLRRAEDLKKRSSLTSGREPLRSQSPVRRRPTSPVRQRLRHTRSRKSDSPSPVRRISPNRRGVKGTSSNDHRRRSDKSTTQKSKAESRSKSPSSQRTETTRAQSRVMWLRKHHEQIRRCAEMRFVHKLAHLFRIPDPDQQAEAFIRLVSGGEINISKTSTGGVVNGDNGRDNYVISNMDLDSDGESEYRPEDVDENSRRWYNEQPSVPGLDNTSPSTTTAYLVDGARTHDDEYTVDDLSSANVQYVPTPMQGTNNRKSKSHKHDGINQDNDDDEDDELQLEMLKAMALKSRKRVQPVEMDREKNLIVESTAALDTTEIHESLLRRTLQQHTGGDNDDVSSVFYDNAVNTRRVRVQCNEEDGQLQDMCITREMTVSPQSSAMDMMDLSENEEQSMDKRKIGSAYATAAQTSSNESVQQPLAPQPVPDEIDDALRAVLLQARQNVEAKQRRLELNQTAKITAEMNDQLSICKQQMMHHAQSLATNEERAAKLRALRARNEKQLNAIQRRKQRLEQQLHQASQIMQTLVVRQQRTMNSLRTVEERVVEDEAAHQYNMQHWQEIQQILNSMETGAEQLDSRSEHVHEDQMPQSSSEGGVVAADTELAPIQETFPSRMSRMQDAPDTSDLNLLTANNFDHSATPATSIAQMDDHEAITGGICFQSCVCLEYAAVSLLWHDITIGSAMATTSNVVEIRKHQATRASPIPTPAMFESIHREVTSNDGHSIQRLFTVAAPVYSKGTRRSQRRSSRTYESPLDCLTAYSIHLDKCRLNSAAQVAAVLQNVTTRAAADNSHAEQSFVHVLHCSCSVLF